MSLDKVYTYDEVIKSLTQKKRQKHLLLGNGFSMSYDSGIFSKCKMILKHCKNQ